MNQRISQHSLTLYSIPAHSPWILPAVCIYLVPQPSCSQTEGLKTPWQPKSSRASTCCSGSARVELQSQTFALVNWEGRRGAGTQSGSLPQTGDKLTLHLSCPGEHLLSALRPTRTPLCSTACTRFIKVMGNAFALCTYTLFSPLLSCYFSIAVLFVSRLNSQSQLLGMIQSSLVTGGWFVGHIQMAGR